MSWLKNALLYTNKPKHSIIGILKETLGGLRPGRDRSTLHASDLTDPEFCPRREAFYDLLQKKPDSRYVSTALEVTFHMGLAAERLFVEEWAPQHVVGNWRCRHCGECRTMVVKPNGYCDINNGFFKSKHDWEYRQVTMTSHEYGIDGNIDCLFDVGAPKLMVTEAKILNPEDFEKIVIPKPEHRMRTNLYMKLASHSVYKDWINLLEAKVLYISRGYGKLHPQWDEVLPFKEFTVSRDDAQLEAPLAKAKALKVFRSTAQMPAGICTTALDKIATKCSVCKECFSGDYPAVA